MCYRSKVASVAFASFISITSFPFIATAESELYVTGGFSEFDLGIADSHGATFRGGWNFSEHLGAEIEGTIGTDSQHWEATGAELGVDSQIGGFLVGRVPIGENASMFARIGYTRTEVEHDLGASEFNVRTDDFAFGFGGEYMFTDRFGIRGDYTQSETDLGPGSNQIDAFTLSGVIKFGGKK